MILQVYANCRFFLQFMGNLYGNSRCILVVSHYGFECSISVLIVMVYGHVYMASNAVYAI